MLTDAALLALSLAALLIALLASAGAVKVVGRFFRGLQ